MRLLDIAGRQIPPRPWAEGDNIPWHDPAFSARMLAEHLSQEHDAASRRATTIDRHVTWLHEEILQGRHTTLLDLGCGPGLYTSRLARLGHRAVGIDYSPASIAHARDEAAATGLRCTYHQADLRAAEYGAGFGLVLLVFGEVNCFAPADAARILAKAYQALDNDGWLILEPHTLAAVQARGEAPPHWSAAAHGLFSDQPHLLLREHFWEQDLQAATIRYFVITLADGAVVRHAQSIQGYTHEQYTALLTAQGFIEIRFIAGLTGDTPEQGEFFAIAARK